MKLFVALALNAALLVLLWRWLRLRLPEPMLGRWLLPLLALKLAACSLATYFISGDPVFYLNWSRAFTEQLWAAPGAWLRTLVSDEFHFRHWHLVYHGFSNTLFFIKLLSALNLASMGTALLNGLYCSLFCFVGAWELARAAVRAWPATPSGAVLLSFLVWPSVVYWTSGITKESLLVGSGAWVTALVMSWLYGGKRVQMGGLVAALVLAVLHFQMRFFFAGLLLAVLSVLILIRVGQRLGVLRRRWQQVLLLAGLLCGGAWLVGQISPVFSFNKFSSRLLINYHSLRRIAAERPHIELPTLQPTATSIAQNAPRAAVEALCRPWVWESKALPYIAAGLENLLLMALLAWSIIGALRGRTGYLPFSVVLVLLTYDLLLAALLGMSTPNLGTLNRYRTALLPYILLLVCQHGGLAAWLSRAGLGPAGPQASQAAG